MISEHSLINYFYRKWLVQVLLLSIFPTLTNTHGFIAETLVVTPTDLVPLQHLHVQNKVLSANLHRFVTYSPITAMTKLSTPELVGLEIGDTILVMHPRQLLYSVARNRWVAAKDFTVSDTVLTADGEVLSISSILRRHSNAIVYAPTVAKYHTFFVSHYKILAHNAEVMFAGYALALADALTCACLALWAAQRNGDYEEAHRLELEVEELKEQLGGCSEDNADEEEDENQEEDIADQEEAKTVDDILEGAEPGPETSGPSKQFLKEGTLDDAIEDFHDLGPINIKPIRSGKMGTLPDGRIVNVRADSTYKTPTLEIYDPRTNKSTKIRYIG